MRNRYYESVGQRVFETELESGLRIRVAPKPGFVRSFAMLATEYGGAVRRFRLDGNLIDSPAGVAHFLEHKMFDMPDGTNVMAEFTQNGASPNAYTGSGMTAYHFDSTENFEKNLRLLLRYVSTPCFTPESVEKEQGIIGQEIRMIEDSPGYCVYINLMKSLYARHPVRDGVAGTIESIAEITDETLLNCWRAFYRPSNMCLCVVGDMEPQRVIDMAMELLPKEKMPAPEPDYGEPEGPLPDRTRFSANMEVSAPQFMLGAKIEAAKSGQALLRQKLIGSLALRCLVGRSSKFFTGLYAEGLLKGDFDYELDYAAGTAAFLAGGESGEPERVLERLGSEVALVLNKGFEPVHFENAKRAMWGSRLRELEDFDSLGAALAEGAFGGYSPLDAFELMRGLTMEDCAAFVSDYLTPEKLALSVIDPLKG